MSLSTVLEVVIGLSFVFFVLSLVCSGINEFLAALLRLRSKTLRRGLAELLGSKAEADKLFDHAAIKSLYRRNRRPSYIPTEKFTLAVLDRYLDDAAIGPSASPEKITQALDKLPHDLRAPLKLFWKDANHDIAVFRTHVEGWFNDTMQRVSGWYRRQTQYMLLGLGIALAVALNVNTVTLAQRLWTDAPFRAAIAEQAKTVEPPPGSAPGDLGDAIRRIEQSYSRVERLKLPMGWTKSARDRPWAWLHGIPGWLLTGLALAMGAPFWFDLLNKASGLRSAGTRPAPARPSQANDEPTPPRAGADAPAAGAT